AWTEQRIQEIAVVGLLRIRSVHDEALTEEYGVGPAKQSDVSQRGLSSQDDIACERHAAPGPLAVGLFLDVADVDGVDATVADVRGADHLEWGRAVDDRCGLVDAVDDELAEILNWCVSPARHSSSAR